MRSQIEIRFWILLFALVSVSDAGMVSLQNGTTFQGTPTGELILVSTGKDLLELAPETIVSLTAREIRLKDGRTITGTIVGGRLRFKTDLGEVAVALTDLKEYRESAPSPAITPRGQESAAPPPSAPASPPVAVSPAPAPVPSTTRPQQSQPPPVARPSPPSIATVPPPSPPPVTSTGERLFRVVASEAGLYTEATVQAQRAGVVRRGEIVRYVDMIDRRIFVLGYLVDFGNWIKVKTKSGLAGWVEADMLQEVREGISAQWIAP